MEKTANLAEKWKKKDEWFWMHFIGTTTVCLAKTPCVLYAWFLFFRFFCSLACFRYHMLVFSFPLFPLDSLFVATSLPLFAFFFSSLLFLLPLFTLFFNSPYSPFFAFSLSWQKGYKHAVVNKYFHKLQLTGSVAYSAKNSQFVRRPKKFASRPFSIKAHAGFFFPKFDHPGFLCADFSPLTILKKGLIPSS